MRTADNEPSTDRAYLHYQYRDSEKLRIRAETHRRYTESPDRFAEQLLGHLALQSGQRLLDVGCGPGTFHAAIRDVRVIGIDLSIGMLREARQGCDAVQANAERLPLVDAAVDRVMANHMLYYVPDQERALREMRRVVRPGGRVVLTTNSSTFMQRFGDVHEEVARELGYVPVASGGLRFTLDDLALVRTVFPAAERYEWRSALLFPTAEPAVQYYATGMVDRLVDPPTDGSHRQQLTALFEQRVNAIIATEGVFRVEKSVGWFVACL